MKDLSPSRGDVYGVSERDLYYDKKQDLRPDSDAPRNSHQASPSWQCVGEGVLKHALTDLGGQFPSNF